MKTTMITTAVAILLAMPAFAANNAPQKQGQTLSFPQRKAEILKRIDERITRSKQERACIQATKNNEDIKACWEKFRPKFQGQRQNQH